MSLLVEDWSRVAPVPKILCVFVPSTTVNFLDVNFKVVVLISNLNGTLVRLRLRTQPFMKMLIISKQ